MNPVVTIRSNRERASRGDNTIAKPSGGEKWDGGTVLESMKGQEKREKRRDIASDIGWENRELRKLTGFSIDIWLWFSRVYSKQLKSK